MRPTPIRFNLRSPIATAWNFHAADFDTLCWFDADTQTAIAVDRGGAERLHTADPFAALDWIAAQSLAAGERWIGYIGYEFARQIETLPAAAKDDLNLPTFVFARCRASTEPPRSTPDAGASQPFGRSMSRGVYERVVTRAIDYIAAGDIFQVNLAQRFSFTTTQPAEQLFDRLPPQHFGGLLEFADFAILSNSPELFFRIEPQPDGTRRIINRPIKGTRPDAPGMIEELERSVKDRAELAMIVDLQRNDLGRVCEIGSVHVIEPRVIERHPTVLHGVATIEGTLRRDAGFADVIRALFPCGSITGCPKIRAMQIIDELEPVARGPYCGAIGYIAADGSAEFNVAIRTMVLKDGVAHCSVGGGIVADSTPAAEYAETLVKARAMLGALGIERID